MANGEDGRLGFGECEHAPRLGGDRGRSALQAPQVREQSLPDPERQNRSLLVAPADGQLPFLPNQADSRPHQDAAGQENGRQEGERPLAMGRSRHGRTPEEAGHTPAFEVQGQCNAVSGGMCHQIVHGKGMPIRSMTAS
jgi:hypothetical protein